MNLFRRKDSSGRKKPLLRREAAGSEHERILLDEAQAHGKQPRGHSSRLRGGFLNFLGGWHRRHRNKEPEDVIHLTETSKGFQQLLQEGQFLQAYLSISESEKEGQDCGPQYQAVAQGMWQVVQQALQGAGHSKELDLKLQAVLATVEQAQHKPPGPEAETLEDGGVAAWDGQLERLLRRDAEARVPRMDPRDQLGPFLEKLGEAVRQGLGSQRASRLGTRLWASYRVCFQEALLGRLTELTQSCGANWKSCCELYTWGKEALFGQLGQESFLNAPSAAPEPTVGHLLDPMMFVTWMSQRQEELVRLTQERLEQALGKVLSCDRRHWAQSSCPTFLEILQLLEETIDAARPIGLAITSQVQATVLETFSKFLNRYQAEAIRFLQQNAPAGAFPEVHLLGNCCILRKTWQELSQAHVPPADLGPAVEGAIHVIEDHSRDHLLPRVRALCQSLLRDHFGRKDKDLVHAVQSLCHNLRGCPILPSTPMYESIMRSLHMVVFGEYVQALATHLRTLAPGKWRSLSAQVERDIAKLDNIFRKHRGPGLDGPQELILEIFQLSENKDGETVNNWLAAFRDRFPGYLSPPDQPRSSADLEVEVQGRCCCCCCPALHR